MGLNVARPGGAVKTSGGKSRIHHDARGKQAEGKNSIFPHTLLPKKKQCFVPLRTCARMLNLALELVYGA